MEADRGLLRGHGRSRSGLRFRGRGRRALRLEVLISLARILVALLGGLGVPLERGVDVFVHAFADFVAITEIELRRRIALLGGLAIPRDGLLEVLRHAFALLIKRTQNELRVGNSSGGRLLQPARRRRQILPHAVPLGQQHPDFVLGIRVAVGGFRKKRLQIGIAHSRAEVSCWAGPNSTSYCQSGTREPTPPKPRPKDRLSTTVCRVNGTYGTPLKPERCSCRTAAVPAAHGVGSRCGQFSPALLVHHSVILLNWRRCSPRPHLYGVSRRDGGATTASFRLKCQSRNRLPRECPRKNLPQHFRRRGKREPATNFAPALAAPVERA